MEIIGIAKRERPKGPMITRETAHISQTSGVESDFRGKFTKRQVTLLSKQQWQHACNQLEVELPWTFRRANLLVEGIEFDQSMLGKRIYIGDVVLEITEETEPCERMDQQHEGLRAALTPDWRGGVCCTVINAGEIKLGDQLLVES